ncbi:MAG: DNA mismatch repair protein MutS [Planctomycetota bacterium]
MAEPKTPMMRQYEAVKAAHPDKLLFFRMGDFYEMFQEDAVVASRILGLTLTSRAKGEKAVPMAGVPFHAADKYMERLIRAGFRVAVCDQMADPATVKGLVPREVTRIVTPGTLTDEGLLENAANNYLAAVALWKNRAGLAYLDISTGEIFLEALSPEEAGDALERIGPAETLLPEEGSREESSPLFALRKRRIGLVTPHPDSDFSASNAGALLKAHYGVASLDGFGLEEDNPALGAAAALLRYVYATQCGRVEHIRPPKTVSRTETLILDRTTIRNLELVETLSGREPRSTLFSILNRACTGSGGRLLRRWMLAPLARAEAIRLRQEAVGELMGNSLRRDDIRRLLDEAADIERILGRVGCGRANARDLAALGRTLLLFPSLLDALAGTQSSRLMALAQDLGGLDALAGRLAAALVDAPPSGLAEGGLFRAGYNAELDDLRAIRRDGRDWIARFQAEEIEKTGIHSLKVGFNKVFGYYIEATKTNLDLVPAHYERRQTLVNAERFVTPELKSYEEKVLGAEERIFELEYRLFLELRAEVAARIPPVQRAAAALAEIDACAALAELGAARRYVMPEVEESLVLQVVDGRHPVLDEALPTGEFVPNDLAMDGEEARVLIITGPNMAGKSTYIRQAALLVLMAQMGAPIPAARARIGLADRLFTRVGASDDLARGQSTFMVEMNEAANILNNATPRSFIVLDEIGRGTSTFDGVSLAWALTEHIHNVVGSRALFATHYHELAELGVILPAAKNYNVAVRDWGGDVIFLHKIQPGSADRSYGIHVAKIAGLPRPVIERARVILEGLEMQASERDSSLLGETDALRAAAREAQRTLFDDPDRDRLCAEVANANLAALTAPEALAWLKALQKKAARWRKKG